MVKDFFLFLALGLVSLVLQSTWLSGPWVNPFRPDLIFILIIFLGTLNRLGLGLAVSGLLGMLVDVLSWGGLGLAMILYPLIFWIFSYIGARTNIQSSTFSVIAVLLFQIIYGFLAYFFLSLSRGLDFSRHLSFMILVQAFITMVVSIPLLYIFKAFWAKKPSLS
jgi:rod shape-determining protein MreD